MSNDFTYILLDIGHRHIRAGAAGSLLPTVNLPNDGYPYTKWVPNYIDLNDYTFDGTQFDKMMSMVKPEIKRLVDVSSKHSCNWMNEEDELGLHSKILEAFRLLPYNLSTCRIVLVDCGFSQMQRFVLSKILLLKMSCKSVQFIPSSILSVISCNSSDGLVVEINWNTLRITSVVDYRVVAELENKTALTGSNVHFAILERLIRDGSDIVDDPACFDLIDSYVSRLSYVFGSDNVSVGQYAIPNTLGKEVLDAFIPSLVDQVSKVLKACNVDTLLVLSNNITFDGDISRIPGLKSAVLQRLRDNFPNIKPSNMQANACLGAWQGGSIYLSTSIMKRSRNVRKTQEVTKEILRDISNEHQVQLSRFPDILNYFKYL